MLVVTLYYCGLTTTIYFSYILSVSYNHFGVTIAMAILNVLQFPDPRLRNKAIPVEEIGPDIRQIAENMLETMYAESGIGLAATQVNIRKRIVVIDLSEDKNEPLILINPEITKLEGKEIMREGCLSVPDYYDTVERAENIEFNYKTLDNQLIETSTDGLLAVCVQHEIDHLDGKLFIDYLSPLKRQRLKKKIDKQEKQQLSVS
jgi:peptide deformylase